MLGYRAMRACLRVVAINWPQTGDAPIDASVNVAVGRVVDPPLGWITAAGAAGAGIRRGVRLPETRTLDVAPTIAARLGLSLPRAEGQPIAGALQ
jgi:hypothetical protein